jgi:hypothetical protein
MDRDVTPQRDLVDELRHVADYAQPPAIRNLLERAAHEIERLRAFPVWRPGPTAILLLLLATPVLAAPPPGADPYSPTSKWVKTLKTSDGHDCCGIADCRPTKILPSETSESGLKAWIGREQFGDGAPDDWVDVPRTALNPAQDDNPTGTSWVCYHSYAEYGLKNTISKWHGDILCATPGSGT